MFDAGLVRAILLQIDEAIEKIKLRSAQADSPDYYTGTPEGMERLDSIAMLFIAIGESLKNVDKITGGVFLPRYPEIDWTGVKGLRDIIAHHYFDIDAEQVFWICKHNLCLLSDTIKKMVDEIK
jgi:uncharacterized protein with HEPN domain